MNWIKHTSGLLLPPNLSQGPALGWYGPQSGNCSCCGGGLPPDCEYFADDFDRADSTSLGSDWTETTGDWSIASNALSIASTGAVVTCNTTHPNSETFLVVSASFTLATNSVARIIVNYVDSTHYHYAEFTKTSTGGTVRLYYNNGGTHTALASAQTYTGTFSAASLCIDSAGQVSVVIGTRLMTYATISPTTSVCGLGTGGTVGSGVTFDDFSISRHADTAATTSDTCEGCRYACITSDECIYDDFLQVGVTLPNNWVSSGACAGTPSLAGDYALTRASATETVFEYDDPLILTCGSSEWGLRIQLTFFCYGSPPLDPTDPQCQLCAIIDVYLANATGSNYAYARWTNCANFANQPSDPWAISLPIAGSLNTNMIGVTWPYLKNLTAITPLSFSVLP